MFYMVELRIKPLQGKTYCCGILMSWETQVGQSVTAADKASQDQETGA